MHHTSAAIIRLLCELRDRATITAETLVDVQRAFLVAYAREDPRTETARVLRGVGNGLAGV